MEQADENLRDNLGYAIEKALADGMEREEIRDRIQDAANDLTRALGHLDYVKALEEEGIDLTESAAGGTSE